ncbi:MAG: beta-ketoacyl synthase N-terminal-like domain-containing protein, partial [Chloroflexia bacterium]
MGNGERRRIVITGMGAVSPIGNSVDATWQAAMEGKSGAELVTKIDISKFDSKIACEIKNFNPEEYIPARDVRRMDRFIHYAIAVCRQAAVHANLTITDENAIDIGVIMGSGIGGIETLTEAV